MKYAVFSVNNKQYRASEGEELLVDRIPGKEGDKVKFDKVLLLVSGGEVKIGEPQVDKASVQASIVSQEKGEKIRVVKYRAKSRYRRARGFRSSLTRLKIQKINTSK